MTAQIRFADCPVILVRCMPRLKELLQHTTLPFQPLCCISFLYGTAGCKSSESVGLRTCTLRGAHEGHSPGKASPFQISADPQAQIRLFSCLTLKHMSYFQKQLRPLVLQCERTPKTFKWKEKNLQMCSKCDAMSNSIQIE